MPRAAGKGYTILGLTSCLACGKEMPAKKTGGGKLSLCCTWCDLAIYINAGTKAHELLLAKVKLDAPPAPIVTAAPSSSSPGEPADRKPPADTKPQDKAAPAPAPRRSAGPLFGGS